MSIGRTLFLASFVVTGLGAARAAHADMSPPSVYLRGAYNRCITNAGRGVFASLKACTDLITQRWNFTNATILGLGDRCLDAPGGNGSQAWMWQCNGTPPQVFQLVDWSREIRGPNGKCLDVFDFGTHNGAKVVLWDCNGLDNQKWTLEPNGEIRGYGGKCLDIAGYGHTANNGDLLQMWDCNGRTNQKFWITGELRNHEDKCLDLPWGQTDEGTQLQSWDCTGVPWQRWQYTP